MASEVEAPATRGDGSRMTETSTQPARESRALAVIEQRWFLVLGAMLVAELVLLLYMGRGLTFYYDEWNFVTKDYGGGLHRLFLAHVGNISIFPVAVYKLLFHVAGLNHYAVYRLVVIVLHLVAATLIFVLSARRTTRAQALLATALVLFLGAAWEDLLWAFQVGYMLSIVGGLVAWVLMERNDRLGDAGAFIGILIAAGSSSLGIAIMVGVAVELAWKREWRRGWIVLIPALLYLLWYSRYGESEVTSASLIAAPGFAADLAASAFGGIVGRGLEWGRSLALLGAVGVAWRLLRVRAITPRLAGLLAAAIALWSLTALARSTISPPDAPRYIYLGAVLVVLLGVECLAGLPASPRALAIAAVAVLVSAVTGLTLLHGGSAYLKGVSDYVGAELGALEIAAANAPPDYRPDPVRAPDITARSYLHTVRAIGSSPADAPGRIAAEGGVVATAADGVLVSLDKPVMTRSSSLAGLGSTGAPVVRALEGGSSAVDGACLRLIPAPHATLSATLSLTGDHVAFDNAGAAPVQIGVARFGQTFFPLPRPLPARSLGVLSFLADAASEPWRAQLSSTGPLTVCGVSS